MIFKDFVNSVLMEMGEYSNSGTKISENENKDYLLASITMTNRAMEQIVTLGKTNYKTFDISHVMPLNQLGTIVWNEEESFNGINKEFQSIGTQSYCFQIGGSGTVNIYEEISGVRTLLTSIVHANVVGQGYVEYKGSLTLTSVLNPIIMVFTGTYYYPFRWIAMFAERFEIVPSFQPYVPYAMRSDFYITDRVYFLHEARQYTEYSGHQFRKDTKEILLNWYEKGEFRIAYYAYPTLLTESETDVRIADNEVLDLPIEMIPALTQEVAGKLKAGVDQKFDIADRFQANYVNNLNAAIENKQNDVGYTVIQSTSGW